MCWTTTALPLLNMDCVLSGIRVYVNSKVSDVANLGGSLCSSYQPFVVVLKNDFLKKQISPFALNFEPCNFADVIYAQTATLHTN